MNVVLISLDVSLELLHPEIYVALRRRGYFATMMSMPKAAMDKDYRLIAREHQIGATWQAGVM